VDSLHAGRVEGSTGLTDHDSDMTEDSQSYIPIRLEHFQLGQETPCDVFTDSKKGKVLLVESRTTLTEPLLESLKDAQEMLFIREEDRSEVNSLVEAKLSQVMADETIEPKEKAEVFHSAVSDSMKALFQQPTEDNIRHVRAVVNSTTELIIQSDEAAHTLFSLAGHDYYTYTHSCNVGIFGVGLAKELMGGHG